MATLLKISIGFSPGRSFSGVKPLILGCSACQHLQSNAMIQTVEWTPEGVRLIDQTKLPTEELYFTCSNYEAVAMAIRDMVVRGAPAIGVTAAMGVALGVSQSGATDLPTLRKEFDHICKVIGETRPTAVNLFWAIRRMKEKFAACSGLPIEQIKSILVEESQRMHVEDIAANVAMG